MKYIIPALLLVALMGYVAWYWQQAPTYGTTVTTINSTDKISDSRSTINTNFSNLNTGKFELSDWFATTSATQLTSLGTISAGTWNATAIAVGYGGTGTTSPSLNNVIIGNAASGFKVIGYGNSGQFLTSAGAGSAPSWTSSTLDSTLSYNWTGINLFTNLNASSTVILGGTSYTFPTTQNSSSSVLATNGSGNLTFVNPQDKTLYVATPNAGTSATATTTEGVAVIPANTLGASNRALRINAMWTNGSNGGGGELCIAEIDYGNGSSTSTVSYITHSSSWPLVTGSFTMFATSTASEAAAGIFTLNNTLPASQPASPTQTSGAAQMAYSLNAPTYIGFATKSKLGGVTCTFVGATVELISN